MLFECQDARVIWRCSNIPNLGCDNPSIELEENIWRLIRLKNSVCIPLHFRLHLFWVIWTIWKSRNEFLFNKRHVHPNEDAIRSFNGVMKWISAQSNCLTHERATKTTQRNNRWEPPPKGGMKINFDSSYRVN